MFREAGRKADAVIEVGNAKQDGGVIVLLLHKLQRASQDLYCEATIAILTIGAHALDAGDGIDTGTGTHVMIDDPEA